MRMGDHTDGPEVDTAQAAPYRTTDADELFNLDAAGAPITRHDGIRGVVDLAVSTADPPSHDDVYHRRDPDAEGIAPACGQPGDGWSLPRPSGLHTRTPCQRAGCFRPADDTPTGYATTGDSDSDEAVICGVETDDGPCRQPVGATGLSCQHHRTTSSSPTDSEGDT